MKTRKLIIEEA